MELPRGPQQGRATPQQAKQPTGPSQKQPFPADKAEAMQFSNDILQVIYDERTHDNIVQQLSQVDEQAGIGKGVGLIAGNLVGNRVADVRGQTGRKIEMKLVVDGVKAVITELGEIAEGEGFFTMQAADRKDALVASVGMLDQMGARKAGGQPTQAAPPQQPPGLPSAPQPGPGLPQGGTVQ